MSLLTLLDSRTRPNQQPASPAQRMAWRQSMGLEIIDSSLGNGLLFVPIDVTKATYAETILSDSPLGYWRMDDVNAIAADQTHQNNGQYVGSVLQEQSSLIQDDNDTSVSFDGATQFMRVPWTNNLANELSAANDLSVEAWISPSGGGTGNNTIAMFSNSWPNNGWWFFLNSAHTSISFATMNGVQNSSSFNYTFTRGSVYKVGISYSQTILQMYINGENVNSDSLPPAVPVPGSGSNYLVFGCFQNQTADSLGGGFDECAVYGSALSDEQIANHYNVGALGPQGWASRQQKDLPVGRVGYGPLKWSYNLYEAFLDAGVQTQDRNLAGVLRELGEFNEIKL